MFCQVELENSKEEFLQKFLSCNSKCEVILRNSIWLLDFVCNSRIPNLFYCHKFYLRFRISGLRVSGPESHVLILDYVIKFIKNESLVQVWILGNL